MDHYRTNLRPVSRPVYDVLWRVFYVLLYPVRLVAHLILWAYDRWNERS